MEAYSLICCWMDIKWASIIFLWFSRNIFCLVG